MTGFSGSSNIFEDELVLREEHHPNFLPERAEELESIHKSLETAARGAGANNIFLEGKAGQGKTAAAKLKLDELERHANTESEHLDLTTCYISCESHNLTTSYKTTSRIYQKLTGEQRPTGHPTDVVMDMMFDAMNRIGGTIIIVLDEIDMLGDDDGILYSLPRARANDHVAEHVFPSVIGISNDLQWRGELSPKVKSSLYEDAVLFSPYDADQLAQILCRRAVAAFQETTLTPAEEYGGELPDDGLHISFQSKTDLDGEQQPDLGTSDAGPTDFLFESNVLEEATIPLVAAKSAQDTGDARQAIKYLRKSAELADADAADTVNKAHVEAAVDLVEREAVVEAMREMTIQAQLALAGITALEIAGETPARTKEIYAVYQRIASEIGADTLGKRRFKDHLRDLDMQGIGDGQKTSGSSPGRPAWTYHLQVNTEIAEDVIDSADRFRDVDISQIAHQHVRTRR